MSVVKWCVAPIFGLGVVSNCAWSQTIHESMKIVPSSLQPMDFFGHDVAIDDSIAVIGAHFDDTRGQAAGALYIYDTNSGQLLHEVFGNDTTFQNNFGVSVAAQGGSAYAGAFLNDTNGILAGAAYEFDASAGSQTRRYNPFQVIFVGEQSTGSAFGFSIDTSEDWFVVGAPGDLEGANGGGGAVYIYDRASRENVGKFFAQDASFADNMGRSVAVGAGIVVAGSPFDDDRGQDSGSAYVFDASTGEQVHKLVADEISPNAMFGLALAVSRDYVIVGAPTSSAAGSASGAVYLFDFNTGQQVARILPEEISAGDRFGSSLDVEDDFLIIGSPFHQGTGVVYVFDLTRRIFVSELRASDAQLGDTFGNSVSISGSRVLVGAEGDDDAGDFAGAAYLFDLPDDLRACSPADLAAPFGTLDFFDVSSFVSAAVANDPNVDFAEPFGSVDFFDVSAFLTMFQAGCP